MENDYNYYLSVIDTHVICDRRSLPARSGRVDVDRPNSALVVFGFPLLFLPLLLFVRHDGSVSQLDVALCYSEGLHCANLCSSGPQESRQP